MSFSVCIILYKKYILTNYNFLYQNESRISSQKK